MPNKPPAFQFYPRDYLSDAKTRAMTFKQRGMYWDLVSYCWLEGGLPLDPREIACILGLQPHVGRFVENDWPVISKCFRCCETDHQHPRLEIERRKQTEHRDKKIQAGKKGGRKHWAKRKTRDSSAMSVLSPVLSTPHSTPIAEGIANDSSSSASSVLSTSLTGSTVRSADSDPEMETSERGIEGKDIALFLKGFCEAFSKHRKGARYHVTRQKDVPIVRQLLATYGLERLKKLAVILLTTDHEWISETDRGIGILSVKASWLDGLLSEHEARRAS